MTRVSLSTALASLLMLYGASNALACSHHFKTQSNENIGLTPCYGMHCGNERSMVSAIDISGSLMSHGWLGLRDGYYHTEGTKNEEIFSSEQMRNYGFAADGMLAISAEGRNDMLGISYGGSLELDLPHVKNKKSTYTSYKQVANRGAKVFINTYLGDLSAGYQVGTDSLMKVDAFSIGVGDNSNLWMRYVNLRDIHDPLKTIDNPGVPLPQELKKLYLENVFYLSTGLYSEGIFEGSSRFSRNTTTAGKSHSRHSLVNALPFRFSYFSPSLGGLRVGVSYAPFGYEEDKITDSHVTKRLGGRLVANREEVTENLMRSAFIVPLYEHVLNVAMTYKGYIRGMDLKMSVTTEYAKNKTKMLKARFAFPKMEDIRNVAFGGMVDYKGVKFAASYGYLGRIDRINNLYKWRGNKFTLDTNSRVIINTDPSYFWSVGTGYEYGNAHISAIYRGSSYSANKFDEIALGIEYDLSDNRSKVECKVFANYHYFSAVSSVVLRNNETSGENKGKVMLAGMKVKF